VASPFVNMQHLGSRPNAEKYPKTSAFVQAMLARPSFAALIVKEKIFLSRLQDGAAS
jgi:glutathione S-transferase